MKKDWIKITFSSISFLLVVGVAYKVVTKSDEATAKEERKFLERREETSKIGAIPARV